MIIYNYIITITLVTDWYSYYSSLINVVVMSFQALIGTHKSQDWWELRSYTIIAYYQLIKGWKQRCREYKVIPRKLFRYVSLIVH